MKVAASINLYFLRKCFDAEADKLFAEYGPNELQEKRQSKLVIYLKLVSDLVCAVWTDSKMFLDS